MTTTEQQLVPIDAWVAKTIADAHRGRVQHLPGAPMQVGYDPMRGTCLGPVVGTVGGEVMFGGQDVAVGGAADRLLLLDDDREVTADELAEVRLDGAGRVVQGVRPPAPKKSAKPVEEPIDPDDAGVPLPELAAHAIRANHSHRVAPHIANPLGSIKPEFPSALPRVPWAYSPIDGSPAGSPVMPEVAEHADRLVILTDDQLPSIRWLLDHLRVHATGRVTLNEEQ